MASSSVQQRTPQTGPQIEIFFGDSKTADYTVQQIFSLKKTQEQTDVL